MGLELVERFFKLTLDNVFRFTCSLLFALAIWGVGSQTLPLAQLAILLDWLAIPSMWLSPTSGWIAARVEVVSSVCALILILAIAFTAFDRGRSRAGSTALLASTFLIQSNGTGWLIPLTIVVPALLVVLAVAANLGERWLNGIDAGWLDPIRDAVWNVLRALMTSAIYVASPLGWLISEDPHPSRAHRRTSTSAA